MAAVEDHVVLVELPAGVHGGAERVELEGELLGVGDELAAVDRLAGVFGERLAQRVICMRRTAVADRAGAAVDLDVAAAKKQPPAKMPPLHVVEPGVEHPVQARDARLELLGPGTHDAR